MVALVVVLLVDNLVPLVGTRGVVVLCRSIQVFGQAYLTMILYELPDQHTLQGVGIQPVERQLRKRK